MRSGFPGERLQGHKGNKDGGGGCSWEPEGSPMGTAARAGAQTQDTGRGALFSDMQECLWILKKKKFKCMLA